MKRIIGFLCPVWVAMVFTACSDNDSPDEEYEANQTLYKEVLTSLSNEVITSTYMDLNEKAGVLRTAIGTLAGNRSEANLTAVKTAWQAARQPWEQSEGFLYGPVDTEGIDPAMDTWPVDVQAMNSILKSSQTITASLIAANNEARGFHLIEFLVWGENGTKTAAQLTTRELEYLQAAAEDLFNNTKKLYDGWKVSGGNYTANFVDAGQSASVYSSREAALEEVVEGMITIADEVANGKIEDPLNSEGSSPNPELEESRFSNNSKLDFANNMRSIQNVYEGKYKGTSVPGLSKIIGQKNASLDDQVKAKIAAAITAIEAIPGTFTEAISKNRPAVTAAQLKVNELREFLESDLKTFVNNNL